MIYTSSMARAYQDQLVADGVQVRMVEDTQPRHERSLWGSVSARLKAIETPHWLREGTSDARTTV